MTSVKNDFIINALENGWAVKKINNKSYEFSIDIKQSPILQTQTQTQTQTRTKLRSKSSPITNKECVKYLFNS